MDEIQLSAEKLAAHFERRLDETRRELLKTERRIRILDCMAVVLPVVVLSAVFLVAALWVKP